MEWKKSNTKPCKNIIVVIFCDKLAALTKGTSTFHFKDVDLRLEFKSLTP